MLEKLTSFFTSAMSFVKDDAKLVTVICCLGVITVLVLICKGVIVL